MPGPNGRGGRQQQRPGGERPDGVAPDRVVIAEVRPIDGAGSNEANEDWGAQYQTLLRLAPVNYQDGVGDMVEDLPNPREISNAVSQQMEDEPSSFGLSDLFWAWGQFIDHDLDLTEAGQGEYVPIDVPAGDPYFDPAGTGEAVIPFFRAHYVEESGETSEREYINDITSFLDASMVYGSDAETAASLRGEGGKLLLDDANLLLQTDDGGVLAGDVRAGENVALTSLQTLFAREHNRLVDELAALDPNLGDEDLYNGARQRVEAQIQAITFNEFLPLLVGRDAIERYDGYDPTVNPGISVEFSTAAFRFGHSLLSSEIQRLNEDGSVIGAGNLSLSGAFFSPQEISENGGIDPILRGLADGTAQELDTHVVEDVRSFLFGEPGSGGLDLASLNIQRGRDMGVASYNDLRAALGLARAEAFSDITSDADLAVQLQALYGEVDLVDAWIGGLAEDPHGDGVIGETFATVIIDQFLRVRDGDPYWSQGSDLPREEIRELWNTTLADVIEANTDIGSIQDNALLSYDRVAGSELDDTLDGFDGRDLLLGLAGNDTLRGYRGDDQLEGGLGDDTLDGGGGRDLLYGDGGDDMMTGGGGGDTYYFSANFGDDRITDFETGRGGDRLVFDDYLFPSAEAMIDAAIQDGGDVLIDFGEHGSLVLQDFELLDLNENDILFG